MRHCCTRHTDLDELIGRETDGQFSYGPLSAAMKNGDELILEHSDQLSQLTVMKIHAFLHGIFIAETEEWIPESREFRLVLR